jgi:acyl-CoA synthetase (AMP-forming)/AMP-acid ligase II
MDLIKKEGVTFSHCVPTILQVLLASPIIDSVDLSAWKVMIGGSALSTALAKATVRAVSTPSAGMSETCPVLTTADLQTPMLDLPAEQQLAKRARTGVTSTDVITCENDAQALARADHHSLQRLPRHRGLGPRANGVSSTEGQWPNISPFRSGE